jgi:hypothetical protein
MPESQVDKLKRELRFLRESFEAGIISEEEFLKGKKRIEKRLDEWGEGVIEESGHGQKPQKTEKIMAEDIIKEVKKEQEQQKIVTQTIIAKKDFTDQQIKYAEEKEEQDKQLNELKQQLIEKDRQIRDEEKNNNKKTIIIQKLEKEIKKRDEKIESLKDKNKSKKPFNAWKYVSIALIAAIILIMFTKITMDTTNTSNNQTIVNTTETTHLLEVEVVVLNDKNCTTCDTTKTIQLIKQLFPETVTTNIDYNTEDGKTLYQAYNVKYLPAYIFSKNLEQTNTWKTNERLRASFTQQTNKYVLNSESTSAKYEPTN